MNIVSSWQEALVVSWGMVWGSFLNILPRVLGAILIFSVGLVLAYWAKRLVGQVLSTLKFERVSKSSGIDDYLKKAGMKLDLTGLISTVTEWLIILVFFLAAVDILGLTVVSTVLAEVLGYVPNVIAAALILGAGYFVAHLVDGLIRGALSSVDPEMARPLGKLGKWVVVLIAFFAAIDQLQVAQGLITTFFQGLTYTIVLTVGLSVGLGAKDLVAKILNEWYEKVRK